MAEPPSGAPPLAGIDPEDRLDSWKEIAAYLERDVSTVQRWGVASETGGVTASGPRPRRHLRGRASRRLRGPRHCALPARLRRTMCTGSSFRYRMEKPKHGGHLAAHDGLVLPPARIHYGRRGSVPNPFAF